MSPHPDAFPLRMALLVRHRDPAVPLVVTIFDPAIAEQVRETIPNCTVTSVADIVAPALATACLDEDVREVRRVRSLVEAVLRPFDRAAALLLYGALGLFAMLLCEWLGSVAVLGQPWADALYGSTKSLATVGPNPAVDDGPSWFKLAIVASMVLSLLST